MSLLSPEVHAQLSQLLRDLSTPDNAVRSRAEEQLNNDWVEGQPEILLMGLAEQIAGSEDPLVSRPSPSRSPLESALAEEAFLRDWRGTSLHDRFDTLSSFYSASCLLMNSVFY